MPIPLIRFFAASMVLIFFSIGTAAAEDPENPLVRSDHFTITRDDMSLLRDRMRPFFETTETEYCRALLKIKLFAMQAREDEIDTKPAVAAELEQMVEQKLSDIYLNSIIADYELLPGSITSYYDSHPEEFTLDDGSLMPLDNALKKKIKTAVMKQKKAEIANKELARLMKKFNVTVINPVCEKKEQTNE